MFQFLKTDRPYFRATLAAIIGILGAGSVLIVSQPAVASPLIPARASANCAATYIVKPGDDLYRIALTDGTTWQILEGLNGIYNPSTIFVGQTLCLPNVVGSTVSGGVPGASTTVGISVAPAVVPESSKNQPIVVAAPPASSVIVGRSIYGTVTNAAGQIEFLGGPGSCGFQTNGGGDGSLQLPLTDFVITKLFSVWHSGIDLAKPLGTPVDAAGSGTVIFAGWSNWGYGNSIVIAHTATLLTLYGHLSQVTVHCGETVTRAQLIGLVGATGWANGPHLHFEIRVNQAPVNPTSLLTF